MLASASDRRTVATSSKGSMLRSARHRATAAKVIMVNTTADQTDPAGSRTVSLRDAVSLADASVGPVTIMFDPSIFAVPQTIMVGNHWQQYKKSEKPQRAWIGMGFSKFAFRVRFI